MKKYQLTMILISLVILFSGFKTLNKSTLRVEISGIEEKPNTDVWVSVFSEDNFLETPLEKKSTIVSGGKVYVEFELQPGEYALSTYHDQNGNKKMDRHFYGKPKEPYGFSNNVSPRFGPPKYDDCKFTLSNSTKTLSIKLLD